MAPYDYSKFNKPNLSLKKNKEVKSEKISKGFLKNPRIEICRILIEEVDSYLTYWLMKPQRKDIYNEVYQIRKELLDRIKKI